MIDYSKGAAMSETHPENVIVGYSVQELFARLEAKIDVYMDRQEARIQAIESRVAVLEAAERPVANGEIRMQHIEAQLAKVSDMTGKLEDARISDNGARIFKEKSLAWLAGLAGVMGVVAGITVEFINRL